MDWSFSADRCSRRCQRQYYFRAIAACHNATKVPLRREAFLRSQVKTLDLWRGLLVHEGIQWFVVPRWEAGDPVDWTAVAEETVAMGRRQFAFSAGRRYREAGVTKTKFPGEYCALAIHEPSALAPEGEVEGVFDAVRTAFANLSRMSDLLGHVQGRPKYWAECPVSVKYAGANVNVRLDLLFFRGYGRPTIMEWKTYEDVAGSDAHLQTALYAWTLCRSPTWRVQRPQDIELIEVQLLAGQHRRHAVTEETFVELEDRMYRSIANLRALYGTHAFQDQDLADFAFARSPSTCRYCPFRDLCSKGVACTASALGLLTIEQQMEEIIIIPARSFALAFDSCFDGFVLAQQ